MSAAIASAEFVLPSLGESIDQATVTRWLKSVGEFVREGEPLLEVATDKVDSEIPAPFAGILTEILVAENGVALTGQALATIAPDGDVQASPQPTPVEAPAVSSVNAAPSVAIATPAATAPSVETVPVVETPLPTRATSRAASDPVAQAPSSAASGDEVVTLSRTRRVIADRMMHSLQSTAQLTSVVEIDVTRVIEKRATLKAEGRNASFFAFFIEAAISAIASHPVINSTIDESGTHLTQHKAVNLGIAVDSPGGLMVPVIRDAGTLSVEQIGNAVGELAERVRGGTITPGELGGGTFTMTNTGSRGALFDTPILNSPQSAILGTGTITRRVVPLNDGDLVIGVRSFAYFSLTYDHRVIDGADAARYLSEIKRLLEA